MYRIAHVSDLHLVAPDIDLEATGLQKVAAAIGEAVGFKIDASPYDEDVLEALRLSLRALRPNAIFFTGDLTNYGDLGSFAFFRDRVAKLTGGSSKILCVAVPGNHDTLTERAAAVDKLDSIKAKIARFARRVDVVSDVIGRLGKEFGESSATAGMEFLSAYQQEIEPYFSVVDPSKPIFIDTGWGRAAVFLFNSNVDDTFMANEGCVGRKRYNRAGEGLSREDLKEQLDGAVRIGLLHHHPISAPKALDPGYERYYNWMKDGPLFLQFLNEKGFHLILHGHQHVPFTCSVTYRTQDNIPLHIVAAGSATAHENASFNVIDLLSPFEIRFQRYDYDGTGFAANVDSRSTLPIRSRDRIRLTPHDRPEIAEDTAVRNLVVTADEEHEYFQYELIECKVKITAAQRYIAGYRHVGKVLDERGEDGPLFVIVGSPAMDLEAMNRSGLRDGKPVKPYTVSDEPTCKKLRVPPSRKLKVGDSFDLTLHFEWQASAAEPNDFDGFNFMQMRQPIGRFVYEVEVPWEPIQPCIREFALRKKEADAQIEPMTPTEAGCHRLRFTVESPKPMVYLLFFGEQIRHDAWDC